MNKIPLPLTLTIATAASLGFVAGYLFHSSFGMELSAARQALAEKEASQRVLDAYGAIIQTDATYKTLSSIKSIDEMNTLQARSKQAVLETLDRFNRIAEEADDRREKFLAQQLLPSTQKIRDAINTEP